MLRLGWNVLGAKGGKALAEGLKYCSSALQQLCLPWSGITDTGASHIAKVCCITVVTLQCHMTSKDDMYGMCPSKLLQVPRALL